MTMLISPLLYFKSIKSKKIEKLHTNNPMRIVKNILRSRQKDKQSGVE